MAKATVNTPSPWADAASQEEAALENTKDKDERSRHKADEERGPKKGSTRPWSGSENRWRPDLLRLKAKRDGWHCRWVSKDQFERRKAEGWQVADFRNYQGVTDNATGTGLGEAAAIERNEMILMEIPASWKEDHDRYNAAKVANQTATPTKEAEEVGAYRYPGHTKD
jgi:hypothetical protein|tara:strand:- start:5556 stop:6059 length:504 start_codon:yes stop_codon:yes gene_type:complete